MINETLVKAAQYIDEHGWTQGEDMDLDGQVCMSGALQMVTFGEIGDMIISNPEYSQAWQRLSDYCRRRNYLEADIVSVRSVTGVNDYVLKTKAEAVKFMMEAAEWEPSNG